MSEENLALNNLSSSYVQTMKAKLVDLKTGNLVAIMNIVDAKELGLLPGDRIELTNPENSVSVKAIVDVTDSIIMENEVGIFKDIEKVLGVKENGILKVSVAQKPKSSELIKKKLENKKLNYEEISTIVKDIADNSLSEVEIAAFVSSVYVNGFDLDETVNMTKALIENGKTIEFGKNKIVDKHSIGGLNGRATMIIVPIIAAAGYIIPKTSSRSITSSAGTADAMEVLADVSLSIDQIKQVVEKTGACIAWGGAVELAPADDKIIRIEYPLSLDPEGQVIASVMAKKASVGAKYVVIDIPIGPFAKVKTREKAEQMALKFVEVGKRLGMKVEVLLTNGYEPSGPAFGPALEAKHALKILEGKVFDNLAQKSVEISGALLELVGAVQKGKGPEKALEILKSGKALQKMRQIISAQNGKIFSSEEIPMAPFSKKVFSKTEGEVKLINVNLLNKIARVAGAPYSKLSGVLLNVETGSKVKEKDLLFEIFSENERKLEAAYELANSLEIIEFEKIILEKFS
ncbi:MAG: AMP phosphorylase [Candidatus Diapherotrites archaeon]